MLAYMHFLEQRGPYLASALRAFSEAFAAACGAAPASERQRLFTAEAAVRLARDSGRRDTIQLMRRIVAELCSGAYDPKDVGVRTGGQKGGSPG
jgi:hypothetical protein